MALLAVSKPFVVRNVLTRAQLQGLLNHLAHPVIVSQSEEVATEPLLAWLVERGLTLANKYSSLEMPNEGECPVVLDGRVLG
jgi:hypothetical protein